VLTEGEEAGIKFLQKRQTRSRTGAALVLIVRVVLVITAFAAAAAAVVVVAVVVVVGTTTKGPEVEEEGLVTRGQLQDARFFVMTRKTTSSCS